MGSIRSARDLLLLGLNTGVTNLRETLADISEEEYGWEPLAPAERAPDRLSPPERKKVWRVFLKEGVWTYDYTPERLIPPPFTTIAWIMNHVTQTADMYLYCIQSGKAEGLERTWDELPVPPSYDAMSKYLFEALAAVREYLETIPGRRVSVELNKLSPAPWGEMRPSYMNLWGGIVEHVIQHTEQIAARKDRIRYSS